MTGGGQVPERATIPEPKRKADAESATAMAEGVPSKLSIFSDVVCNGPKPGGAAERKGRMDRHSGMRPKQRQRHTQSTRGTCPTKAWHSVGVVSSKWRGTRSANDGLPPIPGPECCLPSMDPSIYNICSV